MKTFDGQTQLLLSEISTQDQQQFALNVFKGMTPVEAYKHACTLLNSKPSSNPASVAGRLMGNPEILAFLHSAKQSIAVSDACLSYIKKLNMLEDVFQTATERYAMGHSPSGTIAINAAKQIHAMQQTGAADEFNKLTTDELKRLVGEIE